MAEPEAEVEEMVEVEEEEEEEEVDAVMLNMLDCACDEGDKGSEKCVCAHGLGDDDPRRSSWCLRWSGQS